MFSWWKPNNEGEPPKEPLICHEIELVGKEVHREGHHECYEDAGHNLPHICWCKYAWF